MYGFKILPNTITLSLRPIIWKSKQWLFYVLYSYDIKLLKNESQKVDSLSGGGGGICQINI
jgi:hypothetical protein